MTDRDMTLTRLDGWRRPRTSSTLRIGLIAPPRLTVPPARCGATESLVDHLARGLQAAGCEVLLATTGDARCPVDRCWILPEALGSDGDGVQAELLHASFAHDELVAAGCDLIHDHTTLGPLVWSARPGPVPVVTTHHGVFDQRALAVHERIDGRVPVIAVSEHQAATVDGVPIVAVIHHGVDVGRLAEGGEDLVVLGPMSPDRGVHRAISAARLAGRRLVIAGTATGRRERRYFAEMVEPLLGPDVEFVGAVGGQAKRDLLGRAAALVDAGTCAEPFGLAMIEALAVGTPVVSFAVGSAPEIVEHGRNGFLCRDEADMIDWLTRLDDLDRSECRSTAVARFSTQRLVADHLRLYPEVIAGCDPTIEMPLSAARAAHDAGRSAFLP